MTTDKKGRMTLVDLISTAIIVLLGQEGRDYLTHQRGAEEWILIQWIHRN